ncbi:MAG: endonuclease III [Spirochaetia bacterium]|jgi:endonuclease-3|nr:endonuclease III [Spirochaetia bacterium]
MGLNFTKKNWKNLIESLRIVAENVETPTVFDFSYRNSTPFQILISTIISLRTRDLVTFSSSEKLFDKAPDPQSILKIDTKEIAQLIYPAGFYKRKAENIKQISKILLDKYEGLVPRNLEALLELPGVGRKTANLTLGLSYRIPALCVDTHVHRIPNRMGLIETKTPEKTEFALTKILPKKYWIEINELLVAFGQTICTPVSPKCSECPFKADCPMIGVGKSR